MADSNKPSAPTRSTPQTGSRPSDTPTLARGTSADAEPERPEDDGDDAAKVEEGIAADEELAKSYELPEDQKANQMTPEEYASMGPGAKQPEDKDKSSRQTETTKQVESKTTKSEGSSSGSGSSSER